jgi:WD40 repeat protein
MKDSKDITKNIHLSDEFGSVLHYRYLTTHNVVLCQCDNFLVLITLAGDIIASTPIQKRAEIIATNEDDYGWQILIKKDDKLTLLRFLQEDEKRVYLEKPAPDAKSACWSPCGHFIAIGHASNSSVSVWHTDNGEHIWTRSLKWDVEDFLLDWPPSLTVSGWSADGKYIVTSASLISCSIIIWCADSGEAQTMID